MLPPDPIAVLPPDAPSPLGELGLHPLQTNPEASATAGKTDHLVFMSWAAPNQGVSGRSSSAAIQRTGA